jgi:hypothetical protein
VDLGSGEDTLTVAEIISLLLIDNSTTYALILSLICVCDDGDIEVFFGSCAQFTKLSDRVNLLLNWVCAPEDIDDEDRILSLSLLGTMRVTSQLVT